MTRKNLAYFSISNSPGTTGNLTVSTAVDALHVTLGASDDSGVFSCRIFETGLGSEVRTGCTYTHGTTTLTRGTLESSTTGSALNFTSAAKVQIVASAADYDGLDMQMQRGVVMVRSDTSTTQSFANGVMTKVAAALAVEQRDENGWWDGSAKTFQPLRAGIYAIHMGIGLSTVADGTRLLLVLYKNGTDLHNVARGHAAAADNLGVSGSALVEMNGSTDTLEMYARNNNPGGTTYSTPAGVMQVFFHAVFLCESL